MNIYKHTFNDWCAMARKVQLMGSYLQNPEKLNEADSVAFRNEYEKLSRELANLASRTYQLLPKVTL